ncbi:MAG: YdcF family protein, partial [Flexibacteraceae bacterium]
VDSTDIILESNSRNTHENAINSKRVLDSLGIGTDKVLLSTSAFHMRRARGCFKKVGMNPMCYPTDIKTHQEMPFQFLNFIMPDVSSVERWRMLFHEILGYLMYKVQGYC